MDLNVLMYSEKLASFEYGATHPFKPHRARQFLDLLNRYCLIHEKNQKIVEPVPLKEELLYLFHDPAYIDILKRCDRGEFGLEMLEAGIGSPDNPVVPGMLDYVLRASGGTYDGALLLLSGEARFVFNPLGGFHHAGSNFAEGFCYVNDIAIAISELVRQCKRVAYIDIDVHHGNGVQDAFYSTDRVLTVSIHEWGKTLYPWTGFENEIGTGAGEGYNLNIPLMDDSDDEVYLRAFKGVVPSAVERFKPDIVFAEIGGDVHRDDPLANFNITSRCFREVVSIIKGFAPKIIATGGGGYNVYKTSALWALAWAEFCGLEPYDQFAGIVGGMMYGPEAQSGSLEDEPFILDGEKKQQCLARADEVVEYLTKNAMPLIK